MMKSCIYREPCIAKPASGEPHSKHPVGVMHGNHLEAKATATRGKEISLWPHGIHGATGNDEYPSTVAMLNHTEVCVNRLILLLFRTDPSLALSSFRLHNESWYSCWQWPSDRGPAWTPRLQRGRGCRGREGDRKVDRKVN